MVFVLPGDKGDSSNSICKKVPSSEVYTKSSPTPVGVFHMAAFLSPTSFVSPISGVVMCGGSTTCSW
ncbi:hypothetical protein CEXT_796311 [Caerostris extrusa]|uniref:Uncharacterized protein n=1 Tax=Caerostris extrusa TaxID=172846 RepID=A0AAV4THX8_CAEEX|nr:hypothetical protein CEXT_796311 [Caerostris extrusa]